MTSDYRWYWAAGLLAFVVMIYLLSPILSPFLVGMLLAYLGDPLVDRLERMGMSRVVGVLVVFAAATGLLTLAVVILVPMLTNQISALRDQIPAMIDWVNQTALPWVEVRTGISVSEFQLATVGERIRENIGDSSGVVGAVLAQATRSTMALITGLVNLVLIPVVGFYLLRDWDTIVERARGLIPRDHEPLVVKLLGDCDEVLGAFIRGQLLVMLALGILYSFGLWLVGVDLALLIGMLAGLASLVPYLGFAVGIIPAVLVAAFQFGDLIHPAAVVAVFSIVQMLEGTVLTPWLVGDKIGLHPVAVIFAVMAGGQLFGFVGILLALPVAAVIMVLLRYMNHHYKTSPAYEKSESEHILLEPDENGKE
ncbi:MAG TPA: AI-2E family transporter [Pseudomonas xinjiangensis]|uniref:AI-2E family transporter n=2 Tax=root TaxID=1 RepID=A0A7V1BN10_9GAMM|nr:AI-2E family transporter [Halopseudomonas xinjiangensis]HEC47975.1 AI-2E family transporter [Halopseudomonas xinjiangensis]